MLELFPLDLAVVVEGDLPVARQVKIGFDHLGPLIDGERKSLQGVLRGIPRGAPMGDVQRHSSDQPRERSTARRQPA